MDFFSRKTIRGLESSSTADRHLGDPYAVDRTREVEGYYGPPALSLFFPCKLSMEKQPCYAVSTYRGKTKIVQFQNSLGLW